MTDKTSVGGGGIGEAASDLLKEMEDAQTSLQKAGDGQKGDKPSFQQAMKQAQSQQQDGVSQPSQSRASQDAAVKSQISQVTSDSAAHNFIKEAQKREKFSVTRVGKTEKAAQSRLATMLEGLMGGQEKMNKIMEMALSGQQFSPTELLAMQAGVYRFSQELDLTSKVVEKGTGSIKQTLNTQV